MKNTRMRIMGAVLAVAMLFALAAACSRQPDSLYEPPEFVFVAETLALPQDLGEVNALTVIDDTIIFSATNYEYGDETNFYSSNYESTLYSMKSDGTSAPIKLPNYTPAFQAPANASGGISINSLMRTGDGSFWVYESWYFSIFNLPDDFNPETDMPWEYQEELGSGSAMRQLDNTGAEIGSVNLDSFLGGRGEDNMVYIQTFGIDGSGNVYISTTSMETQGVDVHVLDGSGNVQFVISNDNYIDQFTPLPDGTMAVSTYTFDVDGNYSQVIQKIDIAARGFGENVDLPDIGGWYPQILPGSGEYDILLNSGNDIYGYTLGDEEAVKLLNWLDSDVINNDIRNINMVSEDLLVCTNNTWDRVTGQSSAEVLLLTRTPYSELPQKTVLTLATFYIGNIRDSVVQFNRSNPNYRISIIDYSEFGTEEDPYAGLTRLSTELISGRIPDILDVSNMTTQYKEYVARGLLADLYPMIEADPTYSRSSFVEGAFRAAEINEGLYQVFPSFYVHTLAGRSDTVGPEPGWNMSEFEAVLNAHPEADIPLGQSFTRQAFLRASIAFSIDEYIDWGTGQVHFDTPDFIQLLEFSSTFPDASELEEMYTLASNDMAMWDQIFISEEEAVATGRQLMTQMIVSDFGNIVYYLDTVFGGDMVFKGFPNENRRGNSISVDSALAILDKSPNKEAAWEFVRTVLSKDWQMSNTWALPTNQEAFDERVKVAMETDYGNGGGDMIVRPMRTGGGAMRAEDNPFNENSEYEPRYITQSEIDMVVNLINSASGSSGWTVDDSIWTIIEEGITDYFNGTSSAADAARVIQDRVSTLVAERS